MTRVVALLVAVAVSVVIVQYSPSAAADDCALQVVDVSGGTSTYGTGITEYTACGPGNGGTASAPPEGVWHSKPVCLGGASTCDGEGFATCDDGSPMLAVWFTPTGGAPGTPRTSCPTDAIPVGPTLADVLTAFREIPLPDSDIEVEPVGGETLVNFDTNFFTRAKAFNTSVTLLGATVDFRISPDRYRWAFGDGEKKSTSSPGSRYPDLDVTHRYTEVGAVRASVETTWSADYRINGGPWATVPETVTMDGDSHRLDVRSATPVLVDNRQ